jgi:hypothetical protein
MSVVVYKYPLELDDSQLIGMPKYADILKVGYQGKSLHVWALVDLKMETVARKFVISGTGHELPASRLIYVDTVFDGNYVWHIFDAGE